MFTNMSLICIFIIYFISLFLSMVCFLQFYVRLFLFVLFLRFVFFFVYVYLGKPSFYLIFPPVYLFARESLGLAASISNLFPLVLFAICFYFLVIMIIIIIIIITLNRATTQAAKGGPKTEMIQLRLNEWEADVAGDCRELHVASSHWA